MTKSCQICGKRGCRGCTCSEGKKMKIIRIINGSQIGSWYHYLVGIIFQVENSKSREFSGKTYYVALKWFNKKTNKFQGSLEGISRRLLTHEGKYLRHYHFINKCDCVVLTKKEIVSPLNTF